MLRIIAAFVFAFAVTFGSARADTDLVKRGDYLVNGILTCGNCHSPKEPTGDIKEKAFSGGLSWDEPPFKVTAPNITQDKETGIGKYTDAELKQVLRKGIKRNGVPVAMVMPSGFYEIMTDHDLDAVIRAQPNPKPPIELAMCWKIKNATTIRQCPAAHKQRRAGAHDVPAARDNAAKQQEQAGGQADRWWRRKRPT